MFQSPADVSSVDNIQPIYHLWVMPSWWTALGRPTFLGWGKKNHLWYLLVMRTLMQIWPLCFYKPQCSYLQNKFTLLRNIIWHPLYAESEKKWYKWTYLQNRKRLTDLENEIMVAGTGGNIGGRDSWGVWDGHVHTAVFKMDNQQGPAV